MEKRSEHNVSVEMSKRIKQQSQTYYIDSTWQVSVAAHSLSTKFQLARDADLLPIQCQAIEEVFKIGLLAI